MGSWREIVVGLVLVSQACGGKANDGVDDPAAGSSGGSSSSGGSAATNEGASSDVSTTNTAGTTGASSSAGASATSSGGASATSSGGASATSSGATGGSAATATNGSGGAGSGGAAGAASPDVGFYCPSPYADNPLHCDPGQDCASCSIDGDWSYRCVPSQQRDPAGFDSGTADCETASPILGCDGPEDCLNDEYCVSTGRTRCATEPLFGSCCLSCDAIPQCTFCYVDEDCGEAGVCVPGAVLGEEVGGCTPKPCDDTDQCPAGYACQWARCTPEE